MKTGNLIRTSILNLKPYSSARDEYSGISGIFLDANENPYGELNRYPDPYQNTLKNKIASKNNVNSDTIFIGNGSDEIIDLAFRIFCNPDSDKALTFTPTYGMYEVSAAINNVDLVKLPLTNNFQIDLESLVPYFEDKTIKLLFICSPNNPTGNLINRKDIEFILKNFNGVVVVDEAYIDFAKEDSLINIISKYKNLIVSQTFSKAWALAGARVGVAFANPKIIAIYNRIKPPYNVSELNQQAAINALDNLKTYNNRLTLILKEKEQLIQGLKQIDLVNKIYPSDANFLLVKVKDANQIYTLLSEKNIIIRNRSNQVPNCLRITIGTPEENNQLLKTLKELNNSF